MGNMDMVNHHFAIDDEVIDQGDVQTIISPIWWTATIYDGEEKYNESLASFSVKQRFIFAIMWYLAEVDNGGHDQFYTNSTGIVWKDALAGFKELQFDEAVNIIQESANRLGGNPSLDRETRNNQLDALHPDFDDLDTQYYHLEERLFEIMKKYIREHRTAFYFDGNVQVPRLWLKKPQL